MPLLTVSLSLGIDPPDRTHGRRRMPYVRTIISIRGRKRYVALLLAGLEHFLPHTKGTLTKLLMQMHLLE